MAGTAIAIPSFLNPVVYLVAELFQMLCGLTKSVQSFIFGHSVEAAEPNVEFICNIDGTQGRDDGNPSSIVKENLLTKLQNDISFALKINQNLISQNIQLEEKMTYCIKSDCSTKLKTNSTFCYFWIGYGAPTDTPYDFGSEILNSDSNLSSCSVLTCDLKANSSKNQYLNSLRSSTMDPAIDKNLINTCSRIRYLSECSDDSFICFGGDTSDDDNDDIVNMNPEGTHSDITFESEKEDHEDIENHKTSKKKKKVNFNLTPKIRVMRTWDFAYRKARKGEWELYARDRARFQHRIERTALIIDPVLSPDHRSKIFNDRFTS